VSVATVELVEVPVIRQNPVTGRKAYDSVRISKRYVEGVPVVADADDDERRWPTTDEVAEHFGIYPSLLREACRRQGWVARRSAFQSKLVAEAQALRAKQIAAASVKFDDTAIRTAGRAIGVVDQRFVQIEEAQAGHEEARMRFLQLVADGMTRQAAKDESGYDEWLQPVDAREVESLVRAGVTAHALKARAAGEILGRTQVEITGADGGPVDLRHNVIVELGQDDPGRLEDFFRAFERAKIGVDRMPELPPGVDDTIYDAELLEDGAS